MNIKIFYNVSIDEQMVPYFGRHSAKMYVKGKPVRFGFKIWCMCSSDGYLYKFMPYGGANPNAEKNQNPLDAQVVLDLISATEDIPQHRFFSIISFLHIHCSEC